MSAPGQQRAPWKVGLKWFLLTLLVCLVGGIVVAYTMLPDHLTDEERGRWVGQWMLFPAILLGLVGYFVQEGRNRVASEPAKRHNKTVPTDVYRPED